MIRLIGVSVQRSVITHSPENLCFAFVVAVRTGKIVVVGNIKTQNIRDILLSPKAEKEIISMRKCKGKSCVKTCMMPKSLGEMISIFLKLNKRH